MNHDIEKRIPIMFDYRQINRAKSSTLSTFVIPAIVFIYFVGSFISNLSLQSKIAGTVEISEVITIKRVVPYLPLSSQQEDGAKVQSKVQQQETTIPLKDAGKEELQEIEIVKPNNVLQQFHELALGFFNDECDTRFFMTWISPAEFFGRREFLAVESVFRAHPDGCLMILSETMDSPEGYRILKPILDRGFKVVAATPDMPFLLKKTPAEAWLERIKSGKSDPGKIPLAQNLSNLMRLAVLYRYGGIYLDTDFIVLKSFKGLRNAIGAQTIDAYGNWTRLNNAVLVFDSNHQLLLKFIEEFASTFNGYKWGHNGPYLVSRVVRGLEGTPGYNLTILPPAAFYPVNWIDIERLFKKPRTDYESKWVKAKMIQLRGKTYGLHLWNKMSRKFPVEESSAIRRLISDHCIICENIES